MQPPSDNSPLDLPRLLDDAIAQALAHEDPDRFLAWLRDHVADYETGAADSQLLDAPFVAVLGRSIWNALPLPGNGFKPRPLPEPGRNDPCFCGSGAKYKRCCAGRPMLELDPRAILPTVVDQTPADALAGPVRAGRVPTDVLVQAASQRLARGELWNTVELLEPLFTGEIRRTDEHGGQALAVLCDVYFELGHNRKKEELLERITEGTVRSPLRCEAWQRIAVARLDAGDIDGAWEAFHRAQQDHPDAPGVGLLEIQILMSRGRVDEASERAAFWEKRLRKQGLNEDDRLVSFFRRMSRDPRTLMADMGVQAADGAGARLLGWLGTVSDRHPPEYRVARDTDPAAPDHPEETMVRLLPPEANGALETGWHEVFPLEKPRSIEDTPRQPDNPWDPHHEQRWTVFLEEHAEAFDSLDILDDIATALHEHPQYGADWLDHSLLEPLLDRAAAITDRALRDTDDPRLPWVIVDNRPALRSLARRVYLLTRHGDESGAARAAERMLALNPDDNHGFRNTVVNHRLRQGDDEGALALTEQYLDTTNPECAYGRVLTLYRLGRLDDARSALCKAMEHLPEVPRYLTAKRVKKPDIHPGRITVGGADQAWLYREDMHDVWQATPGALDWLKQAVGDC